MFSQTSLVDGVGSGAGALRVGAGADQTGNLLDMLNTNISGPRVLVGKSDHPGGVKKKRFGAVGANHMYDYPNLAVAGLGENGQAYRQSAAGYLPGNGGGGLAGYGIGNEHSAEFKEAADLSAAKDVMMRSADVMPHFVQPEHMMYVDRTKEDISERLQEQADDYNRMRIQDLMSKGFTEEEIGEKIKAERRKAIEQAEKQPMNPTALVEAKLASMLPTKYNEDFAGTSVAPGGIARRQDATAMERALNVGNPVAMKKKMEAIRHEKRIAGEVPDAVEHASVKPARQQADIMSSLMAVSRKAEAVRKEHSVDHEAAHIDAQRAKKEIMDLQKAAMKKAMGEGAEAFPKPAAYAKGGEFKARLGLVTPATTTGLATIKAHKGATMIPEGAGFVAPETRKHYKEAQSHESYLQSMMTDFFPRAK